MTTTFKYLLSVVLTAIVVFASAPLVGAQDSPTISASVDEAGDQDVTITGEGWPADLAIFILPCPGVTDPADATGDTCDTGQLTPVTVSDDGTFEVTAKWDIPDEGLVMAAGDVAQSAGATGTVTVGDGSGAAADDDADDADDATESEDDDLAETGVETQVLLNVGILLMFAGYVANRSAREYLGR
ncbi:MAG: hypothetical protein V3V01_15995 [Acidimicrobiales bacterium]